MILYDQDILDKLVSGLQKLSKSVSKTMGPLGRNVLIEKIGQAPEPTKDGATVARYVKSDDQFEQMAIDMGVQAAKKTEDEAGDGTTGTINIAAALVRESAKRIEEGVDVYQLQDEMDAAVEKVKARLLPQSQQIETLEQIVQIATISANNDSEMGEVVGEMVHKIGLAPVDVTDGDEYGIKGEVIEGMEVDRGAVTKHFLETNEQTELEDARVLILSYKLNTIDQIDPILARFIAEQAGSVLLVADGYSETVRDYLGQVSSIPVWKTPMGLMRGPLRLVAVEAWGWGDKRREYLLDACVLTGATLIDKKPEGDVLQLAGVCKKVIVTPNTTQFIGGTGETKDRIATLKTEIKNCKSDFDTEQLQIRLGKLSTGVGIIKVAAPIESVAINMKKQLDDAIRAAQSAVEKGALPGGGTTLLIEDKPTTAGEEIVFKAIRQPFETILKNAHISVKEIEPQITRDQVYNVKTKQFGKPFEIGVIDPTKVIFAELTNALGLAKAILAVAVGIVTERKETKPTHQE